ncbi:MAG: hypothetical protein GKC10_01750 [Methanosarcinales archaeon]|nr:hypothetical protein [Methanosarcinales archaeon]
MDTLSELLNGLREFVCMDCKKEEVERILGWNVQDLLVRTPDEFETQVVILFEKGLVLEARYFLNEGLRELNDDCEFRLKLMTDLTSRVTYNVFYSGYIHGQGYIRISIAEVENKMIQKVLEELFVPRLKDIYKPIIIEFKGLFSRDYFGVEVNKDQGAIYYSPVRSQSESLAADILEVVSRLYYLDELLKSQDLRHRLAELDLQMSFLPSVMWM